MLRGGATVIPGATFIPESRVGRLYSRQLGTAKSFSGALILESVK